MIDPVGEAEALFRRIALSFHTEHGPTLDAFLPHKTQDVDGLSLSREVVGREGAAATGPVGKQFYVAEYVASDIRAIEGLTIEADRHDHAVIPQMDSALRQSKASADVERRTAWARALMVARRGYSGPFPGKAGAV